MMHAELCALGEKWLRRHGCRVVLRDPFKAAVYTGECPDVIGWRDGHSILIECKTSRSDFLADKKKGFRIDPTRGMGDCRLYLAPEGVIKLDDLPDGWGLLETDGKRVTVVGAYPSQYEVQSYGLTRKSRTCIGWYPYPFQGNKQCETVMLVSALARIGTMQQDTLSAGAGECG